MAKTKKRPKKYEPKLSINASFEDVIKVSVTPILKKEEGQPKKTGKKK